MTKAEPGTAVPLATPEAGESDPTRRRSPVWETEDITPVGAILTPVALADARRRWDEVTVGGSTMVTAAEFSHQEAQVLMAEHYQGWLGPDRSTITLHRMVARRLEAMLALDAVDFAGCLTESGRPTVEYLALARRVDEDTAAEITATATALQAGQPRSRFGRSRLGWLTNKPRWDGSLVVAILAYLATIWAGFSLYGAQFDWLAWYLTVVWCLPAVHFVASLIGFAWSRRIEPAPPRVMATPLEIVVPTVGRSASFDRLAQTVESFCRAPVPYFLNHQVVVVIDEGCEAQGQIEELCEQSPLAPWVDLLVVPAGFTSPNGVKHKGRANHYANLIRILADNIRRMDRLDGRTAWRRARSYGAAHPTTLADHVGGLGRQDGLFDRWVLHMDDDTSVGDDTMREIAAVIDTASSGTTRIDVAQGVLTYLRPNLTPVSLDSVRRLFLWTADAIRPADDVGKFAMFTGILGRPFNGFHGENMLVRASTEAEIGWDFGPEPELVEDARWAMTLMARRPGRRVSRFHIGRSYGVSPVTFKEFIAQRRRWAHGLTTLVLRPSIPLRVRLWMLFAVASWVIGPLQHLAVVLPLAIFLGSGTSPFHPAVIPVWGLALAYLVWAMVQGMRMNLAASPPVRWPLHLFHYLFLVVTIPFTSLLESVGMGWGTVRTIDDKLRSMFSTGPTERTFDVIVKASAPERGSA